MSGICGIFHPSGASRQRIDEMLAACSLAGDSNHKWLATNSVALGASRRWDFQQVGGFLHLHVAVDADLTNRKELTERLRERDFDSAAASLPEILGRLYLLEGPAFVQSLQGAFSVAIWDESEHRLLLAVDRFGFKSLYWRHDENNLFFASRLGAVRVAQDAPAEVDPSALSQFLLFSVVSAPLTIYRHVERLRPGFLLLFDGREVASKRYWDLQYKEDSGCTETDWSRELREELRGAVHRHVDACGPEATGAYLSGGTDSSSVVAFMSERFERVNTFSISFPIDGYNEISFARTAATRFATCHRERCLQPKDAVEAIPKLVAYYDEPFANSSAIASYYCALLAAENGVDTLLAGDGGDELFGGNARYAVDKQFALYHSVPLWLRLSLVEPMAKLLPANNGWLSIPRRYIRRAQMPNPRRILSYNFFLNEDVSQILESGFLAQSLESSWLEIAKDHFDSAVASSELNRILYMDVKMTLADNDLRKVSGTAELAGIKVRYPLLDTRLVEFSGRIPANLKLKRLEKRYIFKRALKGILPDKILFKKKHGFGVPLGEWFLQDSGLKALVQDVLRDRRTRQRGYFRPAFLDKLVDLHRREHAGFYGEIIWYLVALELWHREHLESLREASIAC